MELQDTQEEEVDSPKNRGEIIVTFKLDDSLQVQYSEMKPWKLWAAGDMLKTIGDQMMVQAQMEQMQRQRQEAEARQELMQSLTARPGGLRGLPNS